MPAPNPLNTATLPSIESFSGNGVSAEDLARLPKSALEEADAGEGDGGDEGDDSEGGELEVGAGADDAAGDGEQEGGDGEEGLEESGEEDEGSGDDAATVRFKNEDGEDVEATLGDLKATHSKFQKLDKFARDTYDELQQVGLKAHQYVEKHRQDYSEALGKFNDWIMTVVAPEFQDQNLQALAEKDPGEYVKVKARIDRVQQVLQGIQQERERQSQLSQEEGQKARTSAVQQAKQVLQRAIPGWNDQVYGEVLSSAVKNYAFKPEEIGAVIDPRLVKMAHDAAKWVALQSGKSVAQKKVVATPKRVVKPGQGSMGTPKGGKIVTARKELRRTGSDAAAVNLLMSKGIR